MHLLRETRTGYRVGFGNILLAIIRKQVLISLILYFTFIPIKVLKTSRYTS